MEWFDFLPEDGVSIHATLAGGDLCVQLQVEGDLLFLSTPPSRVATLSTSPSSSAGVFLSTPPSRVATCKGLRQQTPNPVSIHATLAGGDLSYTVRK